MIDLNKYRTQLATTEPLFLYWL